MSTRLVGRKAGSAFQMIQMSNDGVLWVRVAVCLSTSLSHLPAYLELSHGDHWLADLCQLINSRKQAFQQKLSQADPAKLCRNLITKL